MKEVSREYIRVGRDEVSDITLHGFAICGEDVVRRRIGESERASPEVLAHLAADEVSAVRKAVASNSRTPLAVLFRLVDDRDADVRFSMAENHNLPFAVLKRLAADENPYVSCRAKETIKRVVRAS